MSTITVKGQVTIPKELRDAAGFSPGDKVEFVLNAAGGIAMHKPGTAGAYRKRLQELANRRLIRGITTDELMEMTRGYSEDAPRMKKRDAG
jgi:antitoxin PrlF